MAEGCWFDPEDGQRVCDWIESNCKLRHERFAGQFLRLLPWQRDFIMRLFGWKRPSGLRRFRRALVFVPKKNGKTTLLAALALYGLYFDGVASPEVYVIASKLDQGKQLWSEAASMVAQSEGMSETAYSFESDLSIKTAATSGLFQILSPKTVQSNDGKNVSLAILDEYHAQSDEKVLDILLHGTAARQQPLTVIISTAGVNEDCPLAKEVERARDQLSETSDSVCDTGWLTVIYEAPDGMEWDREPTWRAANPSFGETVTADFYRDLVSQCDTRAKRANFEVKFLNRFNSGSLKWLDVLNWDRGFNPQLVAGDYESLRGRPCYGGFDLSTTLDFTATGLVWRLENGGIAVRTRFFVPEDNVKEIQERTKRPIWEWIEAGLIEVTPGDTIDYQTIQAAILEDHKRFSVREWGYDPYFASETAQRLTEKGLACVEVRQTCMTLNPACMKFEGLVRKGAVAHDGSRVMRWNVDSVRVKINDGDAMRPEKVKRETDIARIDGVVAAIIALSREICGVEEKPKRKLGACAL